MDVIKMKANGFRKNVNDLEEEMKKVKYLAKFNKVYNMR